MSKEPEREHFVHRSVWECCVHPLLQPTTPRNPQRFLHPVPPFALPFLSMNTARAHGNRYDSATSLFLPLMMKFSLPLAVGCSLLVSLPLSACRAADNTPAAGTIALSVAKALESLHYTRHDLDDTMSDRLLKTYLDTLDYNKLFFTQKDIDEFDEKYDHSLDEAIFNADLQPAYTIYDLYLQRVEARVAKIKEMLKTEKFDFDGNGSIELSRQKSPWPKDEADADRIWHDRIENELLTESLSDKPADKPAGTEKTAAGNHSEDKPKDTPEMVVAKRYDRLLRSLHEQTKEDETKYFLNALALAYDPHSEYMSPSEFDNFSIQMRLSLIGIGAMLRKEDEYSKIIELVPGGPAAVGGKLKVDDRITGVAQGNEPFEDVVDMKLDKVVEKIRGKKGSTVRLQVIPAGSTDTSKREIVSITRDEVKLTDGEARAEIIEKPNAQGGVDKLGWITLPGFYAEMDRVSRSAGKPKSTTADVKALLDRLNKEGITGLVIDLRRNGGGSLEEAIKLTGLFIKKGPVVETRSYDKKTDVLSDTDPSITYGGPMVVLTSHLSASASEIFAGALQDYNRALIVGDKNTFGKGTVQTLFEVGRLMSPFGFKQADAGALKLTIQKFYRPSGHSTQLKGVESDIVLPSRYAHLDVGEDALKYPLAYDEIKPADYEKWTGPQPDLNELRSKSATRVKDDPEFRYIEQDIDRMETHLKENTLSLNKADREKELAADKKRVEDIKAERLARHVEKPVTYVLTLADVDKPKLERLAAAVEKKEKDKKVAKADDADAKAADPAAAATGDDSDDIDDADFSTKEKADAVDPVKNESLSILEDEVEQQRHAKLATTAKAKE